MCLRTGLCLLVVALGMGRECCVAQDSRRLALLEKLSACGDWYDALPEFHVNMTQQQRSSAERGETFGHEARKFQVSHSAESQRGYRLRVEVSEQFSVDSKRDNLSSGANGLLQSEERLLWFGVSPEDRLLKRNRPFAAFAEKVSLDIKWLPIAFNLVEREDPRQALKNFVGAVLNEDAKLLESRETIDGSERATYRLISSGDYGFALIEFVIDETDKQAPRMLRFRQAFSKREVRVYTSEDDIAHTMFDLSSDWELNDELESKVPVRVTTTLNSLTGGKGGWRVVQSTRMVTTLKWSKVEQDDFPKQEALVQRLAEMQQELQEYME